MGKPAANHQPAIQACGHATKAGPGTEPGAETRPRMAYSSARIITAMGTRPPR